MMLDGLPLPQCFADGVRWLVGQMPVRGYGELAGTLSKFLDGFEGHIIASRLRDIGMVSAVDMDANKI